jgi:hypothetical protein
MSYDLATCCALSCHVSNGNAGKGVAYRIRILVRMEFPLIIWFHPDEVSLVVLAKK